MGSPGRSIEPSKDLEIALIHHVAPMFAAAGLTAKPEHL
jgi:hypothetical protein